MAAPTSTTWMVKGTIVIACNCDYGCPCNVNALPTQGHCEGGWTWVLEQGRYGDVSLDGLSIGLYADWPKAIHQGGGIATYLIDERADETQRAALQKLLEGAAGGPWAVFRKTFTELHGPRFIRYEVDVESQLPRIRGGDVLDVELEHIRNPVTHETVHPRVVLPEGLVVKEAALVGSKHFALGGDPVTYDHSGKYAAFGFFQYFGP